MASETPKATVLYAYYKRQNLFMKALLFVPCALYALLVSIFIFLPVIIFLGPLAVYAHVSHIFGAFSTKKAMTRSHRTISFKVLREELASGAPRGTFIIESYTPGWNAGRVWWTPDAIPADDAPAPRTNLEASITPHQEWLLDTYTDLKKGKGLLLMAWIGKNTKVKLEKLFPSVAQVTLWSGGVIMKRRHALLEQTDGLSSA